MSLLAQQGLGWSVRDPYLKDAVAHPTDVPWAEVIIDHWIDRPRHSWGALEALCDTRPVAFHCVTLDPAGTDPLPLDRIAVLKELCDRFQPVAVSDHIAWVRFGGEDLGDLLPVPMNDDSVRHIAARTTEIQERLERPLFLESPSLYARFQATTLSYGVFLRSVATEARTRLLFDVNNLVVSAHNLAFNPQTERQHLSRDQIGYLHIAGYLDQGTHWLDNHGGPPSEPTLDTWQAVQRDWGPVPTIFEWDQGVPSFAEVAEHLRHLRAVRHVVA